MKYKLTEESITWQGRTLYRIECVTPFNNVKAGEKGGYVESEDNLSQKGNAWVFDDARVYDNACVYDNARVYGNAWVCGNAEVCGNARAYGNAEVYGNAVVCGNAKVCKIEDYIVFKNNWSSGRYFTWTRSNDMWRVGCFFGTGSELIKKAYADSDKSGKHYEAYVRFVENLKAIEE